MFSIQSPSAIYIFFKIPSNKENLNSKIFTFVIGFLGILFLMYLYIVNIPMYMERYLEDLEQNK